MPRTNKPRRKTSAYTYFTQACREEHLKGNPGIAITSAEFSKLCTDQWKTIAASLKKPYLELAAQDKKRYEMEMQSYDSSKDGKSRKKTKDPNAPKRPLTPFFCFTKERREEVRALNPEAGIGGVAKSLGKMWQELDADAKGPYVAQSEVDKARYEKEFADYNTRILGELAASGSGSGNSAEQESPDDETED